MRSFYVLLAVLLAAMPATGEGFVGLYGGGAFTQDDDATVSVPGFTVVADAEFERSGVVGGRAGGWFDGLPFLGGALDVSWFGPDGKDDADPAELDVIPISFLVMARAPLLVSDEHPNGRLQPYVGVGPSLVVSRIEVPLPGSDFEDTEADVGVDVRAGLAWAPVEPLALFAEYRFTHFEPEYDDRVGGGFFGPSPARIEAELDTHFIQAGILLRF